MRSAPKMAVCVRIAPGGIRQWLRRDRLVQSARQASQFDEKTWQAIDLLGKDSLKDCEEFADLLKKHHRPVGLGGSSATASVGLAK